MADEPQDQKNETSTGPDAEKTNTESMVEQALAEAQAAVDEIATEADAAGDVDTGMPDDLSNGIELLSDVDLDVMVELGRAEMLVEDVLRLGEGSVVELDKLAGDPVDVYVNNRLIARGEVLVLNDNFCIRISEIVDDLKQQAAAAAEEAVQA